MSEKQQKLTNAADLLSESWVKFCIISMANARINCHLQCTIQVNSAAPACLTLAPSPLTFCTVVIALRKKDKHLFLLVMNFKVRMQPKTTSAPVPWITQVVLVGHLTAG